MFERIKSVDAETQTLAELRDLLLPKLMSGEVRLRDVERKVEDAL
jgi:type I restriction enzyme S subunit